MMQLLCYLALTLLCGLSLSSSASAIQCSDTQYSWPLKVFNLCCDKCPPGTHLESRSDKICQRTCIQCEDEMYKPTYNTDFFCNSCENCKRTNMEYLSPCNATHNAVCKCKAGYECKSLPCVRCLPIPTTTTTTTLTPTTLTSTVITLVHSSTTRSLERDATWYPIVMLLLSAGIVIIVVVVVIKNEIILRGISSVKYGCLLPWVKTHTAVPMCRVDEEISKPVQEAGCDCILKTELELEFLKMSQIQV